MKLQSIAWLREAAATKRADRITVLGEIGAFLILEDRTDLIDQAGALHGDGLQARDDRFTFFSQGFQGRMLYPLMAVEPLYTRYACKYEHIRSVYEDEGGRPVVVLKDALLGN